MRLRGSIQLWIISLLVTLLQSPTISSAAITNLSKSSVTASENITTEISSSKVNIFLNTFIPNHTYFVRVNFAPITELSVSVTGNTFTIKKGQSLTLKFTTGAILQKSDFHKEIQTVRDKTGKIIVAVYPTPRDFPDLSLSGSTELVKNRLILSTPVVQDGSYAIASIGDSVKFFTKSLLTQIGFRELSDAPISELPGGQPVYAYLEQKDFSVTATSPGIWRLLDSEFNAIGRINEISMPEGKLLPEGHGITTSPKGNPVVMLTPTRTVDSSWLKRQFPLPVLDCYVGEVQNGKLLNSFSLWDWAVAHKKESQPLLDAMSLQHDPQNPNSPIDICHVNSMEYYKPLNVYVLSLRSPSILVIVSPDLKEVKDVLTADSSLQHFARFNGNNQITALGNYTFSNQSKILIWDKNGSKWNLRKLDLPVHLKFCGNVSVIDKTHYWVGGGCPSPFLPDTLGAIYELKDNKLTAIGSLKAKGFTYSYRSDLTKN